MTKNQKIALGCGGAGCLGLIVLAIAGAAVYFLTMQQPVRRASRNYNLNVNLNDNSANENENAPNVNASSNSSNANSNSSSSTSVTAMSDDDKHKLFYAANLTGDTELSNRVNVKLGILNDDFTPGEQYQQFMADHFKWIVQNTAWIRQMNSAEKARAYVNEHFPE